MSIYFISDKVKGSALGKREGQVIIRHMVYPGTVPLRSTVRTTDMQDTPYISRTHLTTGLGIETIDFGKLFNTSRKVGLQRVTIEETSMINSKGTKTAVETVVRTITYQDFKLSEFYVIFHLDPGLSSVKREMCYVTGYASVVKIQENMIDEKGKKSGSETHVVSIAERKSK